LHLLREPTLSLLTRFQLRRLPDNIPTFFSAPITEEEIETEEHFHECFAASSSPGLDKIGFAELVGNSNFPTSSPSTMSLPELPHPLLPPHCLDFSEAFSTVDVAGHLSMARVLMEKWPKLGRTM